MSDMQLREQGKPVPRLHQILEGYNSTFNALRGQNKNHNFNIYLRELFVESLPALLVKL